MNNVIFSSRSDNWSTPKNLYDMLNEEFDFNFDPCPLRNDYVLDGLTIEWGKRTFVNPPYSDIKKWAKKCYEESLKRKTIVMLIPSRTDTKYWHDHIMLADEIRFIKGRLKFGDATNSAPFPSAVVIFDGDHVYRKYGEVVCGVSCVGMVL